MNRRELLALLPAALMGQDPQHPVVNLDDHGMDMPSGMDAASDRALAPQITSGTVLPVLTRSGGNLRHGVYQDTIFTPERLLKQPPQKLFTVELPGDDRGLEAQPLIQPNQKMGYGSRDLLISATMGNQVYLHDANNGTPLSMTFLGPPIVGTTKIDGWRINKYWGVLSTGVVDNGVLYVVAWTSPDGSAARGTHALFHVDLGTGRVVRQLNLPGDTPAMQRKQRASLTLIGTRLFIPWGTIQETAQGAHGYVTCVDIEKWKIADEWNATPNGSGAGTWMAGQGPSTDGKYLYFMTGNGDYDGVRNFGECFVKMDQSTLRVVDHWSPFRDQDRSGRYRDQDLGSGGCLYIPEYNLVLGAGKDGILYVLNASNLKAGPVQPPIFLTFNGMNLTDPVGNPVSPTPKNIQQLDNLFYGKTHHMHSTPIYWNGKLFCWGENGNGRANTIDRTGKVQFLARTEEIASPYTPPSPGGMPGAMLALSANDNKDGILWATVPDGDANRVVTTGRLFAFDAQNWDGKLPDGDNKIKRLWMSDPHHTYNKFCPPVISGGKAYCTTYARSIEAWA